MLATLAERLGYAPDARLLIVNCDDLGSSASANVAIYEALRDGVATSATLMVPCPWARDAAAMYRGEDVGVHLTLNVGVEQLPLGSDHALPQPARRRRRVPAHGRRRVGPRRPRRSAQGVPGPGRAGDLLGLRRVAPRQPHGHAPAATPRSSTSYLETAVDFGLPLRMAPAARRAADRLSVPPARRARGRRLPRPLRVHERRLTRADHRRGRVARSPASPRSTCIPRSTPTSCASSHPDWENRVDDHALVTSDPTLAELIARAGVTLISFRALRDLQRAEQRAVV